MPPMKPIKPIKPKPPVKPKPSPVASKKAANKKSNSMKTFSYNELRKEMKIPPASGSDMDMAIKQYVENRSRISKGLKPRPNGYGVTPELVNIVKHYNILLNKKANQKKGK